MALKGSLTDVHMSDLIQWNCQTGGQGRLTVQQGERTGVLYFAAGEVVHAQLGEKVGAEAVYELLGWESGTFEVEQNVAAPARSIQMPWSALLIEGLRRLDEQRREISSERKETVDMSEKTRSQRLQDTLNGIVSGSTDIQGVAIVSMDGLIMGAVLPAGTEQMRVGAVAASILNLAGRSVGQLGRGELQLAILQGSNGYVVLTPGGKNATFVALTGLNVNLGMVLLEVREGAQAVAAILG